MTFTAAVAPAAPGAGTPTGTVTFYDGDKSLGTGQLTAVGGAFQATLSAGGLAVGPHTITARYGGDGGFLESASAARTHHVNTDLSAFPRLPGGAYNLKRGAGLAGGSFVGVSLAGASLIGADLTGAILTGADLTGANLSSADLRGADLSAANLRGATGLPTATLTGAVWGTTTCPDGTTSDQNGGTCLGHLSPPRPPGRPRLATGGRALALAALLLAPPLAGLGPGVAPARPALAAPGTFSNPAPIIVPATGTGGSGDAGRAAPYPSTITVAGEAGPITKVTVTLHGLTHTYLADVDVLLVAPSGQSLLLLSDAGLSLPDVPAVADLTLTFDDAAAGPVPPEGAALTSGSYRPTDVPSGRRRLPGARAAPPAGPPR